MAAANWETPPKTLREEYGMHEIQTFIEVDDEPFYTCWERYKGLFYGVPHHVYDDFQKAYYFYEGLSRKSKYFVDVMCNGDFLDKTPAEALYYFAHLAKASQTGVYFYTIENASERRIFIDDSDLDSENSSEFGGNDELSPLESSPPIESLPLCEDLLEKHLIAEEMNVDEIESWSPTCAKQDFVGVELIEEPFMDSLWEEQDNAYETKSRSPTLENSNLVGVERIDFLGVDKFNLAYHPYLVEFANTLKIDLVWALHLVEFQFLNRLQHLVYSKYLFLWHGRSQFLKQSVEWSVMFILLALVGMLNIRSPRLAART
jgi:hypothetical protein